MARTPFANQSATRGRALGRCAVPVRPLGVLAISFLAFGCAPSVAARPAPSSGPPLPKPGDATQSVLQVGDIFPEIGAEDFAGADRTLDRGLRGERLTLVVFWSTWCGFCMLELPHEVELAKRYEAVGLRVVGVNADETVEVARGAAEKHGVPWVNLLEGPSRRISEQLGIKEWPALFLLDADGKVIAGTRFLRSIYVRTNNDGEPESISGLDWSLEKLFEDRLPK